MGRIKPAWYYERQAAQATARANYFRNKQPPTEGADIQSKGAMTTVFYRSLIQKSGTDHLLYSLQVPNTTLQAVSAAEAGLVTTLPANTVPLRARGSGMKPTRVHWYRGDANPRRSPTAWGTMVARYYDNAGDQSHFSIPFSRAATTFEPDDLVAAFNALFGASGSKRSLLGSANGRAHITWETVTLSAQT
jgi:hypothetical protein